MPEEEIRWAYEPVGLRQAHRIGWVGPEVAPQAPISGRNRFRNFSRAFGRLQDALKEGAEALNELEQEGVIQRFEYTFELAWNTLKDRLEHDGVVLNPVTPRAVIRHAFQAKLISEGERWIDMLGDRNRVSHTYDSATFDEIIKEIGECYLQRLDELHIRLNREIAESESEENRTSRGEAELPAATVHALVAVFRGYPDLEQVTLFGSWATGKATARSDIDLATRGILNRHRLGRLSLDLDEIAIPQECGVRAYEQIRHAPLKAHIDRWGIPIYARGKE